jgi:hypothetical protein
VNDDPLTPQPILGAMTYLLELPDGTITQCESAAQARRYAELYVVLMTGRPYCRDGETSAQREPKH